MSTTSWIDTSQCVPSGKKTMVLQELASDCHLSTMQGERRLSQDVRSKQVATMRTIATGRVLRAIVGAFVEKA